MSLILRNQWVVLAGFIVLCLAAGSLGGFAVSSSIFEWYPTLNKPSWNPPNWVFGPVWSTLYVMMAVSAWLVWRTGDRVAPAMVLFVSQLALNIAWSFLFFGARSPWLGLVEIIMLWLALLFTIIAFWSRSRPAALLLLPYFAWVSFAGFLNFTIWQMN